MSLLVADCPRCGTKDITFDVGNQVQVATRFSWQMVLEIFCVCRACRHPTIFLVSQNHHHYADILKAGLSEVGSAINDLVKVERYIGIQDNSAEVPPEHLPENIERIFKEGSACMSIGCYNAATTMFRLCLDLATKSLLPDDAEGLNNRIRRNLGFRLPWLFDNQILPEGLRELSSCIKDDGNDGAHEGILSKEDAADVLDFTFILLERLYTEPQRLEIARQRRAARRNGD
ncbi:DUF4145 domain-containing protein [Oceanimonas smirnovii]|uniref:DUF4145 domain-containing protein n=1 Tax=Oceanimonas smirnovii TaxID=264574 RepID=A0ABW7P510_9GAMM